MATATPTSTRNTIQRSLVLDTVRSMHNHPTPAEIYDVVRQHHSNISRATVYRNLHLLAERGDILCVETPNGADRYDLTTEPHYHLLCNGCGRVFDADAPVIEGLEEQAGNSNGFKVTSATVFFEGLCPDCQ